MRRLFDFFDRTYIINLRERTDRRRETEREFARIRVEVPNEQVRFLTADRLAEQGSFPSIGTRGSFTSHRTVLELSIKDDLKNVLICEDDVAFKPPQASTIPALIRDIQTTDWDILYFGYYVPTPPDDQTGPLARWRHDTTGGHLYAVNGPFMRVMAEYMNECERRPAGHELGGPMSRDGAYNHIRRVKDDIRVFLAVPSLAYQRSSRTNIWDLPFYDRAGGLRQTVAAARLVKNLLRRWTLT